LDALHRLENDHIRVLHIARHRNKLRTGHLCGNRFSIVVRDVQPESLPIARAIAERILQVGAPNYYGEQRFGRTGDTLKCGLDLLQARQSPEEIPKSRRRFLLRLALSAVQARLFNDVLCDRVRDNLCQTVLPGDVVQRAQGRRPWCVQDVSDEQLRLDQGEVMLTGPMFGPQMTSAAGQVLEREERVLHSHNLDHSSFQRFRRLTPGTRRPLLVRPRQWTLREVPEGLRFEFELPPGAYATTLLREFQKDDQV